MESKIVLYHSNEEKRCKDFVNKNNELILSENLKDDIWLGKGMYFWDNRGNAKEWKCRQCRRNPNTKYCIVVANVVSDKLLDLTDVDVYKELDELWKEMCQKCGWDPDLQLGNKLNVLFEALDFKEKYDLIKVYGKYNKTFNEGFYKFKYNTMKAEPTLAVKCIYSVRSANCIVEKELMKEEEI